MSTDIELIYSREFKRSLKRIAKKYRHVKDDLLPVLEKIAKGEIPGDVIPNVGYCVYKVRVKNRDSNQGSRGGYRMIYYVVHPDTRQLLTIYSKAEQSDISAKEIKLIVENVE